MPDKKEAPSSGPNLLWSMIAVLFVLLMLGTYAGKLNITANTDGTVSSVDAVVPTGAITLGEQVINRTVATVRQTPGGPVIGEQIKRAVGKIAEGPRQAYGKSWIRIDYAEGPDGWVTTDEITEHVGWFRALNIFPIIFDAFRPIGIALSLIFGVLLALVIAKQRRVAAFIEKKKQTERQILESRAPAAPVITVANGPLNLPGVPNNLPTGGLPEGLVFEQQAADFSGPKNERWERVERLMNSNVANDWRQAVIEADIILDDMLTRMGYEGNSIGDRLKQIEQSDFVTLNKAWEAHKVRNHLAHRGGDYIFPKNEADRVISLYRQVFKEFYYI